MNLYFKIVDNDYMQTFTCYDENDNLIGFIDFCYRDDLIELFNKVVYNKIRRDFNNFDELFPDSSCMYIHYIEIVAEYQGLGYGTKLMDEFVLYIINTYEYYNKTFVLDACPYISKNMLYKLPIEILVKFYKNFGFETLLDQHDSQLMYRQFN